MNVLLMLLIAGSRKAQCRRDWPIAGCVRVTMEAGQLATAGCTGSAEAGQALRVVEGE